MSVPVQFFVFICIIGAIHGYDFNEQKFPDDFIFGVASSAYQTEGAWNEDGKGENIWDSHLHKHPDFVSDASNGDIACDSYHKFREDVALLKDIGVNFYRFSISWSRILPQGFVHKINTEGVRFYNELIDELLSNGIEPMITLYHFDLPQKLQEIGGWTNPHLVDYFADYAKIAFEKFGDRVKYWITINEACPGYGDENIPPALNLAGVADYMCLRVSLLAHAKAYRLYQNEFKEKQNGSIGITISGHWFEPASDTLEDRQAAERARVFNLAHYLEPLFSETGDFPEAMKERLAERSEKENYSQSRLPKLTAQEVDFVKGACDFIGFNHYTSFLVSDIEEKPFDTTSTDGDSKAKVFQDRNWQGAKSPWLKVVPEGFRKALNWIKDNYNNPPIIVTENGYSDEGELDDWNRVNFYISYLSSLLDAIHEDGVNVKGYAVWSLLDNFEWRQGYTEKFGIVHVDFDDDERKRTPKTSSKFYREVIRQRRLVPASSVNQKTEL